MACTLGAVCLQRFHCSSEVFFNTSLRGAKNNSANRLPTQTHPHTYTAAYTQTHKHARIFTDVCKLSLRRLFCELTSCKSQQTASFLWENVKWQKPDVQHCSMKKHKAVSHHVIWLCSPVEVCLWFDNHSCWKQHFLINSFFIYILRVKSSGFCLNLLEVQKSDPTTENDWRVKMTTPPPAHNTNKNKTLFSSATR